MAVALHLEEEVAVGEDSGSEAKSRVWREGSHCPVFDHHLDLDERSRGLRTTLWHYKSTSPLRGGCRESLLHWSGDAGLLHRQSGNTESTLHGSDVGGPLRPRIRSNTINEVGTTPPPSTSFGSPAAARRGPSSP